MPPQAPRQQGRGLLSRAGGGAPKSPFRRSSGDDAGEAPARPAPIASTRAGVEAPAIDLGPSARDPETGFVLSDRLEEVVARCVDHAYEAQEPCSVLYFRLDRHDAIVGQVGEQRMAELVREVTSLVNDFLKEGTDIPGRWGDDGFAILLPRTSSRIACNLAEQIRFTIGNLTFPGLSEKTTLSLGIAAYPEQAHSPQELLRYAREAAMETQQQGGDAIRVYAGG